MAANQSGLLGAALVLTTVSAVMLLGREGDEADTAADRAKAQEAVARKHQLEQVHARSKSRLEAGAYVVHSKQLSDAEVIQTIVIPEGHTEELDTRCIVYKNSDLGTSSITCAGTLFRQPAPPS